MEGVSFTFEKDGIKERVSLLLKGQNPNTYKNIATNIKSSFTNYENTKVISIQLNSKTMK